MFVPSNEIAPDCGLYHRSNNPTIVLFPDPLAPYITQKH